MNLNRTDGRGRQRVWRTNIERRWRSLPEFARLAAAVVPSVAMAVAATVIFQPSQPVPATPPRAMPVPTGLAPSAQSIDHALTPETVTAACLGAASTEPKNAFTDNPARPWMCAGQDKPILRIIFRKPVTISQVSVVPGWNYIESDGTDRWGQQLLVSQILWRSDHEQVTQKIVPERGAAAAQRMPDLVTTSLSATVVATQRAAKSRPSALLSDDNGVNGSIAIGQIKVFGRDADGRMPR